MYQAGIPLLTGTDAVGNITLTISLPYDPTLHKELRYFVDEVGMSPAEAVNAATRDAARYRRLSDRGIIESGMRADLVLLGSNPLTGIENTKDIVGVWAAGRSYVPGTEAAV